MVRRPIHALLLAAIVTASAATVFAHMKASKMEPAANSTVTTPPARIQVWFTQAPDPRVSRLELAGPAGAVKLGGLQVTAEKSVVGPIDRSLAPGRYKGRWRAPGEVWRGHRGE
jgi:methionine-rich copper-binding protein CopC